MLANIYINNKLLNFFKFKIIMSKKTFFRTLMMISIVCSFVFMSGCETHSVEGLSTIASVSTGKFISPKNTGDLIDISEIRKISKIQDPQIIAEIDWMYKNSHMTKDQFCKLHNDGIDIDYVNMWGYPSVFSGQEYDVNPYPRTVIQQKLIDERNNPSGARHQVFSTMYGGGTIKVRIQSSVPSDWKTAIINACTAWNNLNENVKFSAYYATSTTQNANEIDIVYQSIGSNCDYARRSDGNSSSNFAEAIAINNTFTSNVCTLPNTSGKKAIMMHELGHAIGLAHTDQWDFNGVSGVPCAGAANTDPTSLMRPKLIYNSPAAFSYCDLQVIGKFW